MIAKMTEPYILCWVIQILIDRILHFCLDIQIPTGKTVQYPNDFKDNRTLHPLWELSNHNLKGWFSIEIIKKMTRTNAL